MIGLREFKVKAIGDALRATSGNRSQAAKHLGVTCASLQAWITNEPELAEWRRINGHKTIEWLRQENERLRAALTSIAQTAEDFRIRAVAQAGLGN